MVTLIMANAKSEASEQLTIDDCDPVILQHRIKATTPIDLVIKVISIVCLEMTDPQPQIGDEINGKPNWTDLEECDTVRLLLTLDYLERRLMFVQYVAKLLSPKDSDLAKE